MRETLVDRIGALAAQNLTPEQVAETLSISLASARRGFSMNGYSYTALRVIKGTNCPGPWQTPGIVDALKALHAQDKSMSQIATALNCKFGIDLSRNAVIGKLSRMGITTDRHQVSKAERRSRRPKNTSKTRETLLRPIPYRVRTDLPPAMARKTLLDLEDTDCRWPVGDPKDEGFGYCGRPKVIGKSYCEICLQRAYLPIPVSKPKTPVEKETVDA